jgi:Cys-tRNA(Pro)/Cys-tRNA(Cys) deacylase
MAAKQTPATRAAARAGIAHAVHPYRHDPADRHFGLEAVDRLGLDPARTFKTLIARPAAGRPVCAVIPVDRQLDLKALAAVAGVKGVVLADPAEAERVTGYLVGGISPLGQKQRLDTYLDESAAAHPTVFVSGGRRGLELELAPADLVALTAATVVPIARNG